jgi:hypothetical protein
VLVVTVVVKVVMLAVTVVLTVVGKAVLTVLLLTEVAVVRKTVLVWLKLVFGYSPERQLSYVTAS